MSAPKLTITIRYDNGQVRALKMTPEDYNVFRCALEEARFGNALQIDINDGMETSFPELHSGVFRHVSDLPDGPLWTAERTCLGVKVFRPADTGEKVFVRDLYPKE